MRQHILKIYDTDITYPMAEKLVKEMEKSIDFEGLRSMYRILKDIIESFLI